MTVNYNSPISPMPKANPDRLDRIYSKIMAVSRPSDALRKTLASMRGLTEEQIEDFIAAPIDNRTIVQKILDDGSFEPRDLLGVPGFYLTEVPNGRLCPENIKFKYHPNTECVIAVRDEEDRIIALQSRTRYSNSGCRYIWYSSAGEIYGVTSNSPLGIVPGKGLTERKTGQPFRIAVCEGFFKAAAIARSMDIDCVIFANGIQNTSPLLGLLQRIVCIWKHLSILIVPDMDFLTNKEVMKAYAKLTSTVLNITKDVTVLAWPAALGKGYDDVLLSGNGGCCRVLPVSRFRDALCNEAARKGDPKLMDYINNYFHGRI